MPQYEFDNRNFSFRKVTLSVWTVVRRVVRWVVGSMTLAVVYYLVLSLFVRTDTERQLAQENRMYARLYPQMQEQMALVGDVVEDLRIRDDAIYNQVFHTKAPSVNPGRSLEMLPDTVSERNVVALVEQKADRLTQTASRVESDFLALSSLLAARKGNMPPMSLPIEGLTYAQFGASVGLKISPYYKVAVQHSGLDLIAGQGEAVLATAAGTVSDVTHSGKGLGNVVTIDHGGGCTTRYAHLADILVSKGQKVSRGRKIASVGISGNSFAPHLHYEVLQDGVPQDPVNYFFASLSPGDYADVVYMSVSTEQSLD